MYGLNDQVLYMVELVLTRPIQRYTTRYKSAQIGNQPLVAQGQNPMPIPILFHQ